MHLKISIRINLIHIFTKDDYQNAVGEAIGMS
jgi:hypothetical protein